MARFKIPLGVKIFVSLWIIILLVPPLREIFPPYTLVTRTFMRLDWDALQKRYPDDPRIPAYKISERHSGEVPFTNEKQFIKQQLADYDSLIGRYPKENWLRAQRLLFMTRYAINISYQGTARRSTHRFIDAPILKGGVVCAQEGEKLDPGNAFFPWMQAICHFALDQPEAGIEALQKAADSRFYDDYITLKTQQQLAVMSLDHKLLFEEKMALLINTFNAPFGHFRNVERAAMEVAAKARQRGDDARAIETTAAVMGAAFRLRTNAKTYIGILVAANLEREALISIAQADGRGTPIKKENTFEGRDILNRKLADEFAAYARKHGKDDIATLALEQVSTPLPLTSHWNSDWWDEFGLDAPWGRIAFQGMWYTAYIGFVALAFALVWLLFVSLNAILGRRIEIFNQKGVPARGQVTLSVNSAVWAVLGVGSLAAYNRVGMPFENLVNYELIQDILLKSLPIALVLSWLLPTLFFLWRRNYIWQPAPKTAKKVLSPVPRKIEIVRYCLWAVTVFTAIVTFTSGREMWDGTIFQWFVSPLMIWSSLLVVIIFEIYRAMVFQKRVFGKIRMGKFQRDPQPFGRYFVAHLLKSSAGGLAVMWSLIFLLAALGLWPLRAVENRSIEKRIEVGEVQWILSQIARREAK